MGLLDKLRGAPREEPWRPRLPGTCQCSEHVDKLVGVVIGATPPIPVKDLAPDVVTVLESAEHYLYAAATYQRRGPFQWRLTYTAPLTNAYDADAPASIDDMLYIQAGIENVFRIDETTLAVGAPEMCHNGIVAAFLTALANPRVRRP
jgi:hypothetical protein